MKITVKQITTTAILLAICIVSQFFKNMSVYITGPIINACLIIATLSVGIVCAVILSVITPVTAFLITGAPVIAAVPLVMPCIMLGNAVLCICVWAISKKGNEKIMLPVSMVIGSVVKAVTMGVIIGLLVLPNMLPEKMLPKLPVLQSTYSVTQLVTALIGSLFAYIIWIPLKKIWKENK